MMLSVLGGNLVDWILYLFLALFFSGMCWLLERISRLMWCGVIVVFRRMWRYWMWMWGLGVRILLCALVWSGVLLFICNTSSPSLLLIRSYCYIVFFFFIFFNYLSSWFPPVFSMLILTLTSTHTLIYSYNQKKIHISHLSSPSFIKRFIQLVKIKIK